jgi:hypothetical protein
MKRDPLDRLLKNAALAKREEAAHELAFPAQARILAAWRASRDESEAFLPLLRKAILAAGAVTVLAVGFMLLNVQPETTADVDELAVATNLVNDAIDFAWNE